MTSRRYREFAEKRAAEDLDLYPEEVRAFMLSQAPAPVRKQLADRVDWANVDLISRRCIKKVQKEYDLDVRGAKEAIRACYLQAFDLANELEEEEEADDE